VVVVGILAFLTILWLFGRIGGSSDKSVIPAVAIGTGPPVVIVTVLDPKADPAWVEKIKKNREQYARKHGGSNLSSTTK
jgi:mannan polymerase II complex MNN11 subunit